LKTLKGVPTEEQVESFKKEYDILSATKSPYLMRFIGAAIDDSNQNPTLSMVVGYCEKGSLHKALNNKKLDFDWQTFFKWTHQALSGVNYLHNMRPQMVHRDLKSHNLLLDAKWNIRVADFGLTRTMTITNASSLGMLKGTMAYCAPEIYNGDMFNDKSDVYSMAIVIWEMVTRLITGRYRAPYSEYPGIHFDFQIIIQTAQHGMRPTIHPKTPQCIQDLLVTCWDSNPDNRPSCADMILLVQTMYVQYKVNPAEWENLREYPMSTSANLGP